MLTAFGTYFKKTNAKQSLVANVIGIDPKNISLLCTNENRAIYADEFYKIILAAIRLTNREESDFYNAIEEIFPNRVKVDFLSEFKSFSPEAQFFKKYTLSQKDIENRLGIPDGKISKLFSDPSKRVLAVEIITFSEAMRLDVLNVFREMYGEVYV